MDGKTDKIGYIITLILAIYGLNSMFQSLKYLPEAVTGPCSVYLLSKPSFTESLMAFLLYSLMQTSKGLLIRMKDSWLSFITSRSSPEMCSSAESNEKIMYNFWNCTIQMQTANVIFVIFLVFLFLYAPLYSVNI